MSPRQRQFLLRENGWCSGLIAVAVNVVLLWLTHRHSEAVPLWGREGVVADLVATSGLLPAITVLIATPLVRRAVRAGVVAAAPLDGWTRLRRGGIPARVAAFGAVGVALLGPVVWVVASMSSAASAGGLSIGTFVALKLGFVFLYATVVTPPIARLAMADGVPPNPAEAIESGRPTG